MVKFYFNVDECSCVIVCLGLMCDGMMFRWKVCRVLVLFVEMDWNISGLNLVVIYEEFVWDVVYCIFFGL